MVKNLGATHETKGEKRMNKRKSALPLLPAMILLAVVLLSLTGFALGGEPACAGAEPPAALTAAETWDVASPALLYIRGYNAADTLRTTGSGFVISADGLAFTAAHVVNGMTRVTAILIDGREIEAEILFCDMKSDGALLRIEGGDYTALPVAVQTPDYGQTVRAIGYPQKDMPIITEGIINSPVGKVSGKSRTLFSCDVAAGMSGGPVLDEYGRAVGIVSGQVLTMRGINLAVQTEAMNAALAELKEVQK